MSESGFDRPRRAFAHNTDSEKPIADDDTPVSASSAARRGLGPEATDGEGEAVTPDPPPPSNPFARPGSEAASGAVPAPPALVPAPAPILPNGDHDERESSGTRRSAVSSSSAPENAQATSAGATSASAPPSWIRHNRKTLLLFVIGALVLALLVVGGSFLAGRSTSPPPVAPSTSATPSPSTSVSAVPAVSVDDLMTLEDAEKVVAGATWTIARTAETRDEAEDRPACLGAEVTDVNPTDTFQRAIGTSEGDMLAALHQVDLYATVEAAQLVQSERAASLARCDEVPAFIASSSTVTGIGDDAEQLTVAYQGETDGVARQELHSVLLVRTGRALTMLDVTRAATAVPAEDVVAGLVRSLSDICGRVDGTCPTDPAASPTVPPPVDPVGWLISSDLPRIRPGYGQWVTKSDTPEAITSKGMGCENITLATEPGPTDRLQRTYLLTQDEQTPTTFGMDEMVFDFPDNAAARVFTEKLVASLVSCKDRNMAAESTYVGAVNGTGADGVAVSASMIMIDLATSDDAAVRYQLVVAIADTRVSYLLTSVTADYHFTTDQQKLVALRVAQRNSQG